MKRRTCLAALAAAGALPLIPGDSRRVWLPATPGVTPPAGWDAAGTPEGFTVVPAPRLQMRTDMAAATSVPWIDANGWRYERGLKRALYASLPEKTAALAVAEAHAWAADALLEPHAEDLAELGAMAEFVRSIAAPPLPVIANIGVIDDGSAQLPEVLNLLTRRNLLYRVVKEPDPRLTVNIRLGTPEWPRAAAANPADFAARVRAMLGDDNRLLRIFNASTVIGRLTGSGTRARLHLVNYSSRPIRDMHVRVLGNWRGVRAFENSQGNTPPQDLKQHLGGTEFTIPNLTTLAVVHLEK